MKTYNIAGTIMAHRDTILLDSFIAHKSNTIMEYRDATLQLNSSIAHESNAIMEYRDAILQLDSSIMCEIYEDDLTFIIAIDNDKYDQFEKEINLISFEIHSKFDLEKEIVCVPKDFVLDWDIPIDLIHLKINIATNMASYNYHKHNPNQTKGAINGCAAA